MQKIRAAIIGTGGIANNHLKALQALSDSVEVVAAVDLDSAKLKAFTDQYKIPHAYSSSEAMLAEQKPDLVHICTPPGSHFRLSIQCLRAGAWVLCEKPLCGSLAELDEIQKTEAETQRFCCSVFQWRFGSGARHLKNLIQTEAMGRPLLGICQTTWYRGVNYYQIPWRGKWSSALGGTSMNHGVHTMDLFLWLMGHWEEVAATMSTFADGIETEEVSVATVRFANKALASIVNSSVSPRQETSLRFDFQKATVDLKYLYSYKNENWQFHPCAEVPEEEVLRWRTISEETPSSHLSQLAELLECIKRKERPATSGAEARRVLEFISCLYKSAAIGKPVKRGSLTHDDPFYQHVAGTWVPGKKEQKTSKNRQLASKTN
jgi:predicted dehydrogenase